MSQIYRALGSLAERLRRTPKLPDASALQPGVGLALGGGFARGFAHLGVLQVLEQNQIPIACIAGTSVGSILGASYASGVPLARIAAVCREIHFRDFGRWKISRLGLASNDRMVNLIRRCFQALTFEELRLPTAVVATDLGTGEPVVFTRGDLADAIRASCAFPGLFEPVNVGGRCLADGGLVAPVPTLAARQLGARCVLGVNVGFYNWDGSAPANLFQVVSRALSAAQKNQDATWQQHADIILEPEVRDIEWDAFQRADEAIAAGAEAARRALPRLRKLLRLTEQPPQSVRVVPAQQDGGRLRQSAAH